MTVHPGADGANCLAVVPVFVNAGVAILPAVIAGLASAAAIILKPRELLRLCRAKPHVPLLAAVMVAGLGLGLWWWLQPAAPAAAERSVAAAQGRVDWVRFAIAILDREERGGPAVGPTATPVPPSSPEGAPPAAPGRPVIFRGDAGRCGYGGGRAPVGLAPLWESAAENTMYMSSPLVVGDAVFGASCLLDLGRNYGGIFRLDAATGRQAWLVETFKDPKTGKPRDFKGFFSSPAVSADGKYLVIGQGLHTDADCDLVCLETAGGRLVWTVPTPLHVEGSPAIDGDTVVAGAGAIEVGPDHKAQGNPGFVFAVRLSDGRKLWEYALNDPESSPAIRDGIVYIGSGFNGCAVAALRMEPDEDLSARGLPRLVWRTPTPHPATGAVTVAEDLVLVGCGNGDYVFAAAKPEGAVLALDRATGAVRWQTRMPDAVLGAVAVAVAGRLGDQAVAVCPVRNGEVVALDIRDGRILWRQEDPKDRISGKAAVLAGVAFTGTHAYAVTQDGYLGVMDARDGRVLERHYINARNKPGDMGLCTSSPYVAGGRVYVGSETGGLRCFAGKEAP